MLFWKRFKAHPRLERRAWVGLILSLCALLLIWGIGVNLAPSWATSSSQLGMRLDSPAAVTSTTAIAKLPKQRRSPPLFLARGSKGPEVQELHQKLQHLGYSHLSNQTEFDGTTEQEVRAFQRQVDLVVDGIVGPETQQSLVLAIVNEDIPGIKTESRKPGRVLMSPDMQQILERGKLTIAVLDTDNPPFFMANASGNLWGADVKMAQDLAQELGVELEFNRTATTFNEVVDLVYNHEVDLAISKISRTLKRAQRVRFSQPYLNMRQGLLLNRIQLAEKSNGNNTTEILRQLEGKIGVIQGSSYVGFVEQKFPKATVVELATWTDVVDAVKKGEILAAYRDELEVKKIVLHEPNASLQFQTVALTDTSDPISMVIPWDSSQLRAFVDQYLDTASLDYTADHLLETYADAL